MSNCQGVSGSVKTSAALYFNVFIQEVLVCGLCLGHLGTHCQVHLNETNVEKLKKKTPGVKYREMNKEMYKKRQASDCKMPCSTA